VVVTEEVQEAVREVAVELRAQGALAARGAARGVERDDDVAEHPPGPGSGEREHVGRAVLAAPAAVESADGGVADDEDRELRLGLAERFEVPLRLRPQPSHRAGTSRVLAPDVDDHGL
jgi:hypothetical protein